MPTPFSVDSSQNSDLINAFFDTENVGGSANDLDVEDCLKVMMNFVRVERLDLLTGLDDDDDVLERQLRPQAEIAAQLPVNLRYVSPELAMPLAVMGLYDLAVLIGGCIFCCHFHIPTLENKS